MAQRYIFPGIRAQYVIPRPAMSAHIPSMVFSKAITFCPGTRRNAATATFSLPDGFSNYKNWHRTNGRTTSLPAIVGHVPPDFHADLAVEKISFQRGQLKLKTWVYLSEDEQHAVQELQQMDIPLCNHSTISDLFQTRNEDPLLPAAAAPRVCSHPGCRTSCMVQSCPKELSRKFSPQSHVLYIERMIRQSKSPEWEIDASVWANYAFASREFVEMELRWKKHSRWGL